MKNKILILSLLTVVFLTGCFEISEVELPATADTGAAIESSFLMKTFEADANPHHLIVGMMIPTDWTVDAVSYEGDVFGPDVCTFLHNDSMDADLGGAIDVGWRDSLEFHRPADDGMEWVVYQGVQGYASLSADTAYTDIFMEFTTGGSGNYAIGYFVSNAALDFDYDSYHDQSFGHQIRVGNPVAIDDVGALPTAMTLDQNFPNPFNPTTSINFSIPTSGMVKLAVHDMTGREVATLHNGALAAGNHVESWNGLDAAGVMVPTGMYIYRLESANAVQVRKMMLLK